MKIDTFLWKALGKAHKVLLSVLQQTVGNWLGTTHLYRDSKDYQK